MWATTFRERSANAIRADAVGIDRERPRACRRLWDKACGGRRAPPLLLDSHIIAALMLEQRAPAESNELGSKARPPSAQCGNNGTRRWIDRH